MPNWCTNTLTVKGPEAALEKFVEAVRTSESALSLDRIVPMDPRLRATPSTTNPTPEQRRAMDENVRDFGYPTWYEWSLANWGCKWDVNAFAKAGVGEVVYDFDSAWSPPSAAIKAASRQHPELTFVLEYDEPGMDFAGTEVFSQGVKVSGESRHSKYHEEEEVASA